MSEQIPPAVSAHDSDLEPWERRDTRKAKRAMFHHTLAGRGLGNDLSQEHSMALVHRASMGSRCHPHLPKGRAAGSPAFLADAPAGGCGETREVAVGIAGSPLPTDGMSLLPGDLES